LAFTISKPTSNFVAGNITVTNRTITNFSGTGTSYDWIGESTITIKANDGPTKTFTLFVEQK